MALGHTHANGINGIHWMDRWARPPLHRLCHVAADSDDAPLHITWNFLDSGRHCQIMCHDVRSWEFVIPQCILTSSSVLHLVPADLGVLVSQDPSSFFKANPFIVGLQTKELATDLPSPASVVLDEEEKASTTEVLLQLRRTLVLQCLSAPQSPGILTILREKSLIVIGLLKSHQTAQNWRSDRRSSQIRFRSMWPSYFNWSLPYFSGKSNLRVTSTFHHCPYDKHRAAKLQLHWIWQSYIAFSLWPSVSTTSTWAACSTTLPEDICANHNRVHLPEKDRNSSSQSELVLVIVHDNHTLASDGEPHHKLVTSFKAGEQIKLFVKQPEAQVTVEYFSLHAVSLQLTHCMGHQYSVVTCTGIQLAPTYRLDVFRFHLSLGCVRFACSQTRFLTTFGLALFPLSPLSCPNWEVCYFMNVGSQNMWLKGL